MAKNPNRKTKPVKKDDTLTPAMKLFLAGCVAELYLLIVRRYYITGSIKQVIAWDSYLVIFAWIGVAVLALGAALFFVWKADQKKRTIGKAVAASGAFLAAASFLVHWNMGILSYLTVIVPVAMVLGLLWSLYDRECSLALTVLSLSLLAVWVCRRAAASIYVGTLVKAAAIIYIVVLLALILLVKKKKLPAQLFPAKADPQPVYVSCGLSVAALAAALVNTTIAYYAMWALAAVVFALAVYYTVKQL